SGRAGPRLAAVGAGSIWSGQRRSESLHYRVGFKSLTARRLQAKYAVHAGVSLVMDELARPVESVAGSGRKSQRSAEAKTMQQAKGLARRGLAGAIVWAVLASGCHSFWQGWLDPSQVGRFEQPSVSHDIRTVISIQDEPGGIPEATEPTPEDGVVTLEDYKIGPGDVIDVSILDLLQLGVPSIERSRVSDLGYITLSVVGPIKVAGKTARQVELEIIDRLRGRQLREPQVRVIIQEQRHRIFNIVGAVARPGAYVITKPDFRLLDAIALAGDFPRTIQQIYVIRKGKALVRVPPEAEEPYRLGQPAQPETQPGPSGRSSKSGPETGLSEAVGLGETAAAAEQIDQPGQSELADQQQELAEALGPAGQALAEPATQPLGTRPAETLTKWIWLNGKWVEVRPPTRRAGRPEVTSQPAEEAVDWEALAEEEAQPRVIAIPVDALMRGESRYNIVIHDGDVVRVPLGPVGEFYIMGHVYRPGVYSLTGRQVTLRQAIAAAGGLSPLAWPSRCELIRRIGQDREEVVQVDLDRIFAGKEPDIFLKPNDVINVGTHPAAPFLATVRNAFRMTYGFGFVYDRNFADIDSFAAQSNPRDRRRFERAQRFPQIFP
ncbi:MAG: polysaccharide biosynthesis/export family protein, partial [Phycisphaerae bacterium]